MQEAVFAGQSWTNFQHGMGTEVTRRAYNGDLAYFMEFIGSDNPDKLLDGIKEQLENQIIAFIAWQKQKELSTSIIRRRLAAITLFYEMNRTTLAWKYIRRTIGRGKKKKKDSAYTPAMLGKLYSLADIREKPILSGLSGTGVREAGYAELKIRNLAALPSHGIYRFVVYEGDEEEYVTWGTRENKADFDNYFAYRIRCGERCKAFGKVHTHGDVTYAADDKHLDPDAPAIREIFNKDDPLSVQSPQHVTPKTIYHLVSELAIKAGVRRKVTMEDGVHGGAVRHDVKAVHGLRKYFDTTCTNAGIPLLWVELLQGRTPKGSKDNYYRPSETELLEGNDRMNGYMSAINDLTINEEYRLKTQLKNTEEELKQTIEQRDMVIEQVLERLRALEATTLAGQSPGT